VLQRSAFGTTQGTLTGVTTAGNKKYIGELAERYPTGLISQGWGNTQVGSPDSYRDYTLRKNCLTISEFDNEGIVISQYLSQTNGALAEWIYALE
jgi:hypothetical protein